MAAAAPRLPAAVRAGGVAADAEEFVRRATVAATHCCGAARIRGRRLQETRPSAPAIATPQPASESNPQPENAMHQFTLTFVLLAAAFGAVGCGKDSDKNEAQVPAATSQGTAAAPDTSVPTAPDAIRAAVRATVLKARSSVEKKSLADLHAHAAKLWSLSAALRTAKAPYGRLFQLSRDLDAKGGASDATGAADALAALENEVSKPSSDVPDDGDPLTANAQQFACPMQCEGKKTYDKAGKCPVCEMDLQPVVAGAFAHSRHQPQHGGQFIMAEDNWHHVEGTLPSATQVKLFLYDNFSMPLSALGVTATLRVTVKHRDRKGGVEPEHKTFDTTPGPEGTTLVAAIPNGTPWPIETRAVVTFPGKKPFSFDYQFKALSVEPAPGAHGAEDTRPIPTGKAEILAALDELAASAKSKAEAGTLKDLHALAARLAKLSAALGAAGGRPGRLEKLASDLHEQGDGGNKAGALEVVAEIARDVEAAKK